jgi:Tfp pilus assembly protein PilW
MQTISKTLKIFLTALILSNIVLMACVVYFFLNNKQSLTA